MKEFTFRIISIGALYTSFWILSNAPHFITIYMSMVGGRFQYLTIISMWFSMIYQFLKIALPKSVRYICNYLILPTFVLQLIVFTLFWTLYSINPLLLQSKRLENESSIYRINSVFVTHLLPSIIMSVEWWLHCKNNSNNSGNRLYNFASIDRNDGNHMRKIHRTLITTWSGLYLIWVLYLYRVNGKWVYPFLKLLNVWQWIALTICSVSLGLLFESILFQLSTMINKSKKIIKMHEK